MKLSVYRLPAACLLGAIFSVVTSSVPCRAQVLAEWTFDETAAPSNVAANTVASDFTWTMTGGPTVLGVTETDFQARWNTIATQTLNTTKYVEFTLTADPGTTLDLTALIFDIGINYAGSVGTRTANVSVRSDAEETPFTTNLSLTPGPVTTATVTAAPSELNWLTYTADLSGPAFQGLESITFRMYPFGGNASTNAATNVYTRWDNIQITGSAIPEPATWVLLLAGATAIFHLRRRRSRTGH